MLRLSVFAFVVTAIISCRKGELPQEHFFGKVEYSAVEFPNTPKFTVFLNGKQLDTLYPQHPSSSIQVVGTTGKLSFYIAGTNTLIADTTITINKNTSQQYRIIYNEDLNLKGFVASKPNIAADSAAYQFYVRLGSKFEKYKSVDFTWLYIDEDGNIQEGETIKGIETGKLNTTVRFSRVLRANGDPIPYALQMKDPATGELIAQANEQPFFSPGQFDDRSFNILYISSDADDNFAGNIIKL